MDDYIAVERILRELGITANYIGCHYLIEGICMAIEDKRKLACITKEIYLELAIRNHSTLGSVERNMRTAITAVWRKKPENFRRILGYPFERRPSVSQFISSVVGIMMSEHSA